MIKPQLEITIKDFTEYGLGKIEIGERIVTHEGLRTIPRMVWIDPEDCGKDRTEVIGKICAQRLCKYFQH